MFDQTDQPAEVQPGGDTPPKDVPCFVTGTRIATPQGQRLVEDLRPGDLILTQDHGPQPLRWRGTRRVAATGKFAPIHIAAGTFGDHGALCVSPLHRIVIRDVWAHVMFGAPEVLVAARDLVNDHSVRRLPGGMVTYVHLLFDQHQIILAEGLETESFLPGPDMADRFDQDVMAEITALFPELETNIAEITQIAARPALKRYEAALWRAATEV